jgi:hypothetical protein
VNREERLRRIEKGLADLAKKRAGFLVLTDSKNGDNYVEIAADLSATANHRRWPASKLPALSPAELQGMDRLGFRETEHNLTRSYSGWSFPRIAANVESVFVEAYACPTSFDLSVRLEE